MRTIVIKPAEHLPKGTRVEFHNDVGSSMFEFNPKTQPEELDEVVQIIRDMIEKEAS